MIRSTETRTDTRRRANIAIMRRRWASWFVISWYFVWFCYVYIRLSYDICITFILVYMQYIRLLYYHISFNYIYSCVSHSTLIRERTVTYLKVLLSISSSKKWLGISSYCELHKFFIAQTPIIAYLDSIDSTLQFWKRGSVIVVGPCKNDVFLNF